MQGEGMDEREWLAATDCWQVAKPFWGTKRSERKETLGLAAVWRRMGTHFSGDEYLIAAEVAEKYADDRVSKEELEAAQPSSDTETHKRYFAAWRTSENAFQGRLFRDIFGNPFRPATLDLAWRSPRVLALAHAAYEQRILPSGTLEPDRLAVLADALEESGCASAEILGHLRGPGPHYRGCWVVDLLLGKK